MKKRLDILVSEKAGVTRTKAQALIMAGQVFVNRVRVEKSGTEIEESKNIEIKDLFPYVSRGALKLEKAAQEFEIDFKNRVVCDIGASTGGFTDYALQAGAKKVYAIDVGYGQLAQKIREDERVIVMERTNIKDVNSLPAPIDIFVIDVSFISLKKVLPQIQTIIRNSKLETRKSSDVVALVKPQFEVGKNVADKFRGVITDPKIQEDVLEEIKIFAKSNGFIIEGETESPIKGAKGNREFLLHLKAKN
ncbi:TlyA family RNA methyltransferase [Patescibacteria group bacterium]|nr:TlyA family RNA methyltransferase [Patescibacteria group bacterium]